MFNKNGWMLKVLTYLLIGSVYTNAMGVTIEAQEKTRTINNISQFLNENQFSYKNIIVNYQKINPVKAKELNTFFNAHPAAKNIQIPKVQVEQDRLSLLIKGQKFNFTLMGAGKVVVSSNSISVAIDDSMNPEKILEILTTHFKAVETISIFNLFISEANAQAEAALVTVLIIVGIIVVIMSAAMGYDSSIWEGLVGEVEKIDYMCRGGSEADGDDSELSDLKIAYNKLTDIDLNKCHSFFNNETRVKALCRKMQLIKKCLKNTIDRIEKRVVNNSGRGAVKKEQYDSHQDKFIPKSLSR